MVPDPYARTTFRGKPLDNATAARLRQAEAELGYELTVIQGIGGASASAGTHLGRNGEGGRAVDLAAWDHERKVPVLRDLGFDAYFRPDLPGVWGEHVHAGLFYGPTRYNPRGASDSLLAQLLQYDHGLNGLADHARDPNPYRPSPPVTFTYPEYAALFRTPPPKPVRTPVTRARDRIVEAMHAAGQAAALLDAPDVDRPKAEREIDDLRKIRHDLRVMLERMPKR